MSRCQRELSIAQRRRRRHITPARIGDNDLVGIPWKEERDIRKAIYHSLRDHQPQVTPGRRPRINKVNYSTKLLKNLGAKTKNGIAFSTAKNGIIDKKTRGIKASGKGTKSVVAAAEEEDEDAGISKSPHPRQSRPLPGDLSQQFLFASSYSRSFALLSSRAASRVARRTLVRAAAANAANTTPVPPRRGPGRPPSSISTAKSQKGRLPKIGNRSEGNGRRSSLRRGRKAETNEDFMEVLVEGGDGRIASQIISRTSNSKTTPVKSQPQKCSSSPRNAAVGGPTRASPRQLALPTTTFPEKWQDSRGQPVNVQDFVDFLCSYGTPCMDQRLAWFMNVPGRRCSTTSNGDGNVRSPNRTSGTNRKGTVRVFPSCSSPKLSARPVVAPQPNHKAPVLPVARKSVSNWPVHPPEDNGDRSLEKRSTKKVTAKATRKNDEDSPIQRNSLSPPLIVDDDDDSKTEVRNGALAKKSGTVMMKRNKKIVNKEQKLKARSAGLNKRSPLTSTLRKATPTNSLSPPSPMTSNRSPLRSPLSRSGLRSQALLRTRRQQRLRQQ